ncbi:MAG: hypothetical protein ACHQ2Y_05495 [Candidatus Lutacidiplasmatales archaeon]
MGSVLSAGLVALLFVLPVTWAGHTATGGGSSYSAPFKGFVTRTVSEYAVGCKSVSINLVAPHFSPKTGVGGAKQLAQASGCPNPSNSFGYGSDYAYTNSWASFYWPLKGSWSGYHQISVYWNFNFSSTLIFKPGVCTLNYSAPPAACTSGASYEFYTSVSLLDLTTLNTTWSVNSPYRDVGDVNWTTWYANRTTYNQSYNLTSTNFASGPTTDLNVTMVSTDRYVLVIECAFYSSAEFLTTSASLSGGFAKAVLDMNTASLGHGWSITNIGIL